MTGQKTSKFSKELKKYTQIQYSQKSISARNTHENFARVTMDDHGKVTKLAVSR